MQIIIQEEDIVEYQEEKIFDYGPYEPQGGTSKNIIKTYKEQENTAIKIFDSFFIENKYIIHLIGEPQQGKTGVVNRLLELLINNYKKTYILKDNIFILTGDNNVQWKIQTSERIPEILKDNIYIGNKNNINKFEKKIGKINDNMMFIIDESHIASKDNNMLIKLFNQYGFNDNNKISQKNIRYLTLSATDPRHWLVIERINNKFFEDGKAVVILLDRSNLYISLEKLLTMKNLLDIKLIYNNLTKKYDFELLENIISTKYIKPKYHIIRMPIKIYNEKTDMLKKIFKNFNIIEWNSRTKKDEDINLLLIETPKIHTWIIIKEMFRTSKTLIKHNIGLMIDRIQSKIHDDTIVQSLAGRCCGYEYFNEITVYTNIDSIKRYIYLLDDISKIEKKKFKTKTLRDDRGYLLPKIDYEYYCNIPEFIQKNQKSVILWRINDEISNYNNLNINCQEFTSRFNLERMDIKCNDIVLCLAEKTTGFLGIWEVKEPLYYSKSDEIKIYKNEYKKEIQKENWRIKCKLIKNFESPIIINNNEIYGRLCKTRHPIYLKKQDILYLKKEGILNINTLF